MSLFSENKQEDGGSYLGNDDFFTDDFSNSLTTACSKLFNLQKALTKDTENVHYVPVKSAAEEAITSVEVDEVQFIKHKDIIDNDSERRSSISSMNKNLTLEPNVMYSSMTSLLNEIGIKEQENENNVTE